MEYISNLIKNLNLFYIEDPFEENDFESFAELLKRFPDRSIDLILTAPPYGLNKTGIKNDCDLNAFYSSLNGSYRVLKDDAFYITFFSTKLLPKLFINNPFSYFWNLPYF